MFQRTMKVKGFPSSRQYRCDQCEVTLSRGWTRIVAILVQKNTKHVLFRQSSSRANYRTRVTCRQRIRQLTRIQSLSTITFIRFSQITLPFWLGHNTAIYRRINCVIHYWVYNWHCHVSRLQTANSFQVNAKSDIWINVNIESRRKDGGALW